MPGVNTTIDNASPLIYYTSDWDTSKTTDSFLNEYYRQTYSVTTKAGGTATFNFTGTGVWLYGAFRSNHGIYNVTIDGEMSTFNGTAGGDGLYQQVMFSKTGLDQGPHTVQLINTKKTGSTAGYNLDLDFIVWETQVGSGNDALNQTTVEDTESSFTWGPLDTAWMDTFEHVNEFQGGSGHATVSSSAFATFKFTGTSVSIYGAVGPAQGAYSVQLDDGAAVNYTAIAPDYKAKSVLYAADGLSDGQHTVKLLNTPAKNGDGLAIDYAMVAAVQVPLTTSTTSATSTTGTSSSSTDSATNTDATPSETADSGNAKKGVPTGAIVAAIVGVIALMAMISFALMMFRKRRQSKKDEMEPDMMTVPFPEPYSYTGRYIPPSQNMNGGYNPLDSTATPPLYPPSRPGQSQSQSQAQAQGREGYAFPSYGPGNGDGVSIFSGVQPAVAPRQSAMSGGSDSLAAAAALYNRNRSPSDVSGTEFAYSGMSDGTSRYPAHGHSDIDGQTVPPIPPLHLAGGAGYSGYSGNPGNQQPGNPRTLGLGLHNPPPQQYGIIPPRKGTGATLPVTASADEQRQFAALSDIELRQRRMQVAGRAQDFGPVIDPLGVDRERPLPELPPDYNQATEALNSSEELSQSHHSHQSYQSGQSGQLTPLVQHSSPPSQSPQPQPQLQPQPTQLNQTEGHNSQ